MCVDKRVLLGLGVAAAGVFAFAPGAFLAVAPLLLFAACPLSMLFMMRAMRGDGSSCRMRSLGREEGETHVARPDADLPVAQRQTAGDTDAQVRELQEEVARLRAEVRLRERGTVS